ncbi:hypothetical protein AA23498_2332 [Acetobacter nitrogenifigens DSM 23921 = NBRC 105050]|nr:hypothetical protein AA23498_2332 [Acetobacter nitrogenifigens DSM 23921 = NBRC 105050]
MNPEPTVIVRMRENGGSKRVLRSAGGVRPSIFALRRPWCVDQMADGDDSVSDRTAA